MKKKKKKLLTCGKVKREQQSTSSSLEGVAVVGTNVNTLPSGVDGACTAKKIKLEPAQRDKSLKSRIRRGGGLQLNFHNARQGRCARECHPAPDAVIEPFCVEIVATVMTSSRR